MLCLNNSLFGFGITKLLLEVDLRIRASLLTIVGLNISQMYKGASWTKTLNINLAFLKKRGINTLTSAATKSESFTSF